MACVPQFDTMHPSVSLGANFNDRNFRHLSGKFLLALRKYCNIEIDIKNKSGIAAKSLKKGT